METDKAYFERRAVGACLALTAAADERAREAHAGMAERYEELSSEIALNEHLGLAVAQSA